MFTNIHHGSFSLYHKNSIKKSMQRMLGLPTTPHTHIHAHKLKICYHCVYWKTWSERTKNSPAQLFDSLKEYYILWNQNSFQFDHAKHPSCSQCLSPTRQSKSWNQLKAKRVFLLRLVIIIESWKFDLHYISSSFLVN